MIRIKPTKKYLIFWIISFSIISVFSFSKDPFIDEITSLLCSINFEECISWDSQLPTYYFFIKPLTIINFTAKIEFLRLIHTLFISFSIVLIIKGINNLKKLTTIEEIIILLSLSLVPLIYSSVLIRPYSLSFLFSSISFHYFIKYLKNRNIENLKKSFLIDSLSFLIFYFNVFFLVPKIFYLLIYERKNFVRSFTLIIKIFLPSFILLFSYILVLNARFHILENWNIVTGHYKNFEKYYKDFLINFPIELFKEQTIISADFSTFYSVIFKIFTQILFLFPLFYFFKKPKDKYLFLYFLTFLTIFVSNITFSFLTSKYLILSRQFVYLSLPLISLLAIFLAKRNKTFLILFLPLTFLDYSIYRLNLIFNEKYIYFPVLEVMNFIKNNEEILVTPYYCSQHFWYFQTFIENKNITIYDIHQININWYKEENSTSFVLRKWNTEISSNKKIIIDNYKIVKKTELENITKVFIETFDAKNYCKDVIKEIKKSNIYILICK